MRETPLSTRKEQMFICENCTQQVPLRQPVNYVVTEKRKKAYEKPIKKKRRIVEYELVLGWEIVKQKKTCPDCFKQLTGEEPRTQQVEEKKPKRYRGFNTEPVRRRSRR